MKYLKFLFQSTNQHGVHSPFVYSFVTKGLYKKNTDFTILNSYEEFKNLSKKERKIISKVINYFYVKDIYFDTTKPIITLSKTYKILFISDLEKFKTSFLENLKPFTILIFKEIYANKASIKKWEEAIQHQKATVTIDLFYFGFVFYRKEQVKEHFKIRA